MINVLPFFKYLQIGSDAGEEQSLLSTGSVF
jgi:hypothetical protein